MRIKLDFDNRKRLPSRRKMQAKLRRAGYAMADFEARRSPSGTGWHVLIATEPIITNPMEVVALQAVLGSDPFREASNVMRVRNLPKMPAYWRRPDRWNVLYIGAGKTT